MQMTDPNNINNYKNVNIVNMEITILLEMYF